MDSNDQKSPLLYVLVAVGAVSLLMAAWVLYQRSGSPASVKTTKAPASLSTRARPTTATAQCVPTTPHPVDQLQMQVLHAHDLVRQHNYAPAISVYREVADADPDYPGIQLELSMALLDAKQPDAANDAVNAQLAVSNCLGELTLDQMQAYCRAEMPSVRVSTCQEQVLDLRRSAHLHAALVQMQLGRDGSATPDPAETRSSGREARVPVSSSPTRIVTSATKPVPATGNTPPHDMAKTNSTQKPAQKASRNPLERGDETDAALGAYSR